jgi:hypothetical protein
MIVADDFPNQVPFTLWNKTAGLQIVTTDPNPIAYVNRFNNLIMIYFPAVGFADSLGVTPIELEYRIADRRLAPYGAVEMGVGTGCSLWPAGYMNGFLKALDTGTYVSITSSSFLDITAVGQGYPGSTAATLCGASITYPVKS